MVRKFTMLEHKVLSAFSTVRKGDKAAPLSKEEASNMVERVRIFADERCKILKTDLEELKIKLTQSNESERLMKKKIQ